jgi:hypothetical protein
MRLQEIFILFTANGLYHRFLRETRKKITNSVKMNFVPFLSHSIGMLKNWLPQENQQVPKHIYLFYEIIQGLPPGSLYTGVVSVL